VASPNLKHGFTFFLLSRLKKLKFCPKCGSTEIYWASGLPQLWSIWDCKECGYRGALVIEDSKLATKIRERYLKGDGKEKRRKERSKKEIPLKE
jgi:predicted nucleic-acid-binding Zn-ribbon protein